jgi:uncharacterized membrane protein YphA (DoxX/SURF4 family)
MKNKILNVVAVLFSLMLINSGLNKFFNYIPMPDDLPAEMLADTMAMVEIEWLMPLIGFAEVLGGLLIIFPKTRALGAVVVFPVMVGILLTHVFVAPDTLLVALVLWAILLWIIFENKHKYLALLNK